METGRLGSLGTLVRVVCCVGVGRDLSAAPGVSSPVEKSETLGEGAIILFTEAFCRFFSVGFVFAGTGVSSNFKKDVEAFFIALTTSAV